MITIKVTKEILDQIEQDYNEYIVDKNIGYILFVAKTPANIITAYDNKKGQSFKVTIQGNDFMTIAKKYSQDPELLPKKKKANKESLVYIDVDSQIGSDEVGTGDFLGPIVVCAAYCDHETMKLIEDYGIKDSKKFTDKKILEVVPMLLKKVHFEVKILSNERFNDATLKGFNMNRIKCILHDHVLKRLKKRCPYVKNVYVDQFCPANAYYEYLKGINEPLTGIIFKEKGETYFPSVALGSCIARYYFLKYIEDLSEKYHTTIPLGASSIVDEFAKEFASKYGIQELKKICKINFANYKNLMDEKIALF